MTAPAPNGSWTQVAADTSPAPAGPTLQLARGAAPIAFLWIFAVVLIAIGITLVTTADVARMNDEPSVRAGIGVLALLVGALTVPITLFAMAIRGAILHTRFGPAWAEPNHVSPPQAGGPGLAVTAARGWPATGSAPFTSTPKNATPASPPEQPPTGPPQ